MSDKDIHQDKYSELRSKYKYFIDSFNALYQLKAENEEDLNKIYKMIKTELIDSRKYLPVNIIRDIINIIPFNNRYTKEYLSLAKLISDDYHIKEVNNVIDISNFLFYKEYGIKLTKFYEFENNNIENLDVLTENTIYRAIMNNDLERFISFTELEGFDKNQRLKSELYPCFFKDYSLLELCCYHGAVDCFKFLRTRFNLKITEECLEFSFLGGNQEIMSECLKYQKPNKMCMKYAIISHNIDFVTFLMNEYNMEIDLNFCGKSNNLESFLVYFDQTNDINIVFVYSTMFEIPSFCEYLLSQGAKINEKDANGKTALHIAADSNSKDMVEFLISHGANINEKDKYGFTALHIVAENNNLELAELLIAHGANINEKDKNGKTALHIAIENKCKETAELLIIHGANINEKDKYGKTALHIAIENNNEITELLILHNANINEKDGNGKTALHLAMDNNCKEIAELLILHGANINERNIYGFTALHIAARNSKETTELLILHGANINEKDKYGKTALHIAIENNNEIAELLILHNANINEKDGNGFTALHLATLKKARKRQNILLHMVPISMKKIIMDSHLFVLQKIVIIQKQPNFLFHMAQKIVFMHNILLFLILSKMNFIRNKK
ncbi:ankyrin repeat protein, putative [Trichomonas vaginalis G3]|uniref:Ankyrin repeat protein, putative n=1 Tax=Trichomonas vaginalis (strain ATCC PRA-98 / G3) TaxID=412133 RepID=A2DT63_TRIV3|nr:ankyrin repeat and SOCS box-containing protein 4 family [Trichomonas vaginalis G3]EAY16335.1 ankyrin repeat protein, putative [Trichomonas vaginalis G3]KAI5488439.1 ankyrin repeat and SOCS box-containing protein 4 family [Trichomonas vaginalis G3]|eukprot:XP_001328558.1 ankyrin repeat protein [Trichomonas vaginalis G3]